MSSLDTLSISAVAASGAGHAAELVAAALLVELRVASFLFTMRVRRYYFVRHGQTLLNAKHVKQGAEGGLSEKGKAEAARAGKALSPLHIGCILSSPYERARQTADIMNKALRTRIRYTPLLAERRNPSEVIGKNRDDPAVVRIVDQIELAYHEDDYRYSDEENFLDLKARAKKCLHYLARHGASKTCVITHHAFLKMILAYMLYRGRLTAAEYVKLSFFNVSDNGGITICEYHPWKRLSATRGWSVVSFNEIVPE